MFLICFEFFDNALSILALLLLLLVVLQVLILLDIFFGNNENIYVLVVTIPFMTPKISVVSSYSGLENCSGSLLPFPSTSLNEVKIVKIFGIFI